MIIDFHTHVFPDEVASDAISKMEEEAAANGGYPVKAKLAGTAKALEDKARENGIDWSIVLPVATSPRQAESINLFAARANENSVRTGLFSLGAIHPDNENYKEILRGLKAREIKGIKLHPDYQGVYVDDMRYLRIMDFAADLDLVIVVHAGTDIGKPQEAHSTVDRLCTVDDVLAYPKLVLAHMGGYDRWEEVEQKLLGRNIYLDTAMCFEEEIPHMSVEQFRRFVDKHGFKRILFGTDSPWADQGRSVEMIKSAGLLKEQEAAILGGNALQLLGLEAYREKKI